MIALLRWSGMKLRGTRRARPLRAAAFGANEGVTGVGQPVDHCIEVVFKTSGNVNSLYFQGQGSLAEEFFIIAEAVEPIIDAGFNQFSHHFGARFDFDQGPHWLPNRYELSTRLEQSL